MASGRSWLGAATEGWVGLASRGSRPGGWSPGAILGPLCLPAILGKMLDPSQVLTGHRDPVSVEMVPGSLGFCIPIRQGAQAAMCGGQVHRSHLEQQDLHRWPLTGDAKSKFLQL